tara:strand:- start:22904 stop:23320 length:417 start_codon:yes stop_codon:yes gene_type:complete
MLLGLADKHYVDLSMSTMVGDSDIDRQSAGDAGIGTFIWAHEFFGWDPDPEAIEILSPKSVLHHGEVFRRGDVVVRDPGPWTPAVHGLLHHLGGRTSPRPVWPTPFSMKSNENDSLSSRATRNGTARSSLRPPSRSAK